MYLSHETAICLNARNKDHKCSAFNNATQGSRSVFIKINLEETFLKIKVFYLN